VGFVQTVAAVGVLVSRLCFEVCIAGVDYLGSGVAAYSRGVSAHAGFWGSGQCTLVHQARLVGAGEGGVWYTVVHFGL
jgi:hypothetical protein